MMSQVVGSEYSTEYDVRQKSVGEKKKEVGSDLIVQQVRSTRYRILVVLEKVEADAPPV